MCLCVFSPKASNEALYSQVVRLRCGIKLRPGNKQLTGGEKKKKKQTISKHQTLDFGKRQIYLFMKQNKTKKKLGQRPN